MFDLELIFLILWKHSLKTLIDILFISLKGQLIFFLEPRLLCFYTFVRIFKKIFFLLWPLLFALCDRIPTPTFISKAKEKLPDFHGYIQVLSSWERIGCSGEGMFFRQHYSGFLFKKIICCSIFWMKKVQKTFADIIDITKIKQIFSSVWHLRGSITQWLRSLPGYFTNSLCFSVSHLYNGNTHSSNLIKKI